MNNYRSLNHTKWECQYHVVFIAKYPTVSPTSCMAGLRIYDGVDVLLAFASPHIRRCFPRVQMSPTRETGILSASQGCRHIPGVRFKARNSQAHQVATGTSMGRAQILHRSAVTSSQAVLPVSGRSVSWRRRRC